MSVLGIRVPFAGGGYFRRFPLRLVSALVARTQSKRPVVFYVHPCEIEVSNRIPDGSTDLTEGEARSVERRFASERKGRDEGADKLRVLLRRFKWGSIEEVFRIGARQSGEE